MGLVKMTEWGGHFRRCPICTEKVKFCKLSQTWWCFFCEKYFEYSEIETYGIKPLL